MSPKRNPQRNQKLELFGDGLVRAVRSDGPPAGLCRDGVQ